MVSLDDVMGERRGPDPASVERSVQLERVLMPSTERYRTPVYYVCSVYGGLRPLMAEVDQSDLAEVHDVQVGASRESECVIRKVFLLA